MFDTYAQDLEVSRFLLWRPHANVSESHAVVNRFNSDWEARIAFCWFIFNKHTGDMLGSIAARPEIGGFNLGYLLARSAWGRGYMPEAIRAVVEWAFTEPSINRITAACDVENHASARALEKAGFIRHAILPKFSVHPNISEEPRDYYEYARVRA